jgi:hypothetical protein
MKALKRLRYYLTPTTWACLIAVVAIVTHLSVTWR